jgi:hypothetical protein
MLATSNAEKMTAPTGQTASFSPGMAAWRHRQDRGVPAIQRFAAVAMYFTMLIFTMLLTTENAGGSQGWKAKKKAASPMTQPGKHTKIHGK